MDEKSIELARALNVQFASEMTPQYQDVRNRLIGSLTVANVTYDQIKTDNEQAHANLDLIRDFTQALPMYAMETRTLMTNGKMRTIVAPVFTPSDAFEARVIRESVLWTEVDGKGRLPFWVVGSKPTEKKGKKGELLLISATEDGSDEEQPIYTLPIRYDEYLAASENRANRIFGEFTKTELADLHNFKTQRLEVASNTRGVFWGGEFWDNHLINEFSNQRIPLRSMLNRYQKGLDFTGARLVPDKDRLESGITDNGLVEYGVFDQLNILGIKFGISVHLDKVLADRGKKFKQSIADQLTSEPPSINSVSTDEVVLQPYPQEG